MNKLIIGVLVLFVNVSFGQITPATMNAMNKCREAEQLLQQGKFSDAYSKAFEAIKIDSTYYEGYYWGGISLYKQNLVGSANDILLKARAFAPPDKLLLIDETLKVFDEDKKYKELIIDGDNALKDGLNGKAAQIYYEAWKLFPKRTELAFKSINIFIETEQERYALIILSDLRKNSDEAIALKASELYNKCNVYDVVDKLYLKNDIESLQDILKIIEPSFSLTKKIYFNDFSLYEATSAKLLDIYAKNNETEEFKNLFRSLIYGTQTSIIKIIEIALSPTALKIVQSNSYLNMIKEIKGLELYENTKVICEKLLKEGMNLSGRIHIGLPGQRCSGCHIYNPSKQRDVTDVNVSSDYSVSFGKNMLSIIEHRYSCSSSTFENNLGFICSNDKYKKDYRQYNFLIKDIKIKRLPVVYENQHFGLFVYASANEQYTDYFNSNEINTLNISSLKMSWYKIDYQTSTDLNCDCFIFDYGKNIQNLQFDRGGELVPSNTYNEEWINVLMDFQAD